MTRDRVGLALLAVLLGLAVVGGATAGSGTQATPWGMLSHGGSAARYLSSIGVNPNGFVVQRGRRNYAGPRCPGKGWTCTKSHRVLQFSTMGGTVNSVVCSATGGGGSVSSSAGSSSESCTIVQVSTSGSNSATCNEQSSTTSSGTLTQTCSITQTSGTGANNATVTQNALQGPSACSGTTALQSETGTQSATVTQSSSAGAGTANVSQTLTQCVGSTTTGAVNEGQTTAQTFTVAQGPVGFNPSSPNCTNHGILKSTATQSQHQHASAAAASSGSQSQHADLNGHVDQCSIDHADYGTTQTEDQSMDPNPNVAQTMVGPMKLTGAPARSQARRSLQKISCCSVQATNPTDFCTITQSTSQTGNPAPQSTQTEEVSSSVGTSGSCNTTAQTTQNGATSNFQQTGSNLNQTVSCQQQVCTGAQAPTSLAWSGDTAGTYHDNANLAATLTSGGNPVSGQTVALAVGGESCAGVTDANGVASCSVTLGDTPGGYSASATFGGTASFAGSATGPVSFTVTKAPSVLTYGGDLSQYYDDTATLSAHLAEAHHTGTPIAGRTVAFSVSDGGTNTQTCSGTTDSSGNASCQFTVTLPPGSYTVSATFDGTNDSYYTTSSDSDPFTVVKAPTTLTYTGDLSQDYNDPVTLSGHLAETHHSGTAIAGRTVAFSVTDGTNVQGCSGTTDSNGNASCQFVLTLTPGSGYTVKASFDGSTDTYYTSSSDSKPFVVTKEETAVVYTGATSGDYSDQVTLKGVLTEDTPGGPPLAGRQLTLTLGTQSCNGTTNASGVASCSLKINQQAGLYSVTASFAGDSLYQPGSGSATFTVTPEEDSLSYTGPTYAKKGSQVTLSAKLTSDLGGISGRLITFKVGSQSCTGTTNSSGAASCTLTLNQSVGSYTVTASFAGDAYFEPASCSKPFSIKSS